MPLRTAQAMEKISAIVLLSGGLDSATVLALAHAKQKQSAESGKILALSFAYGQRHAIELKKAAQLAANYEGVQYMLIPLAPQLFGGTALVPENQIAVPQYSASQAQDQIPLTYVPARNILFLAHALALAESHNCFDIFLGVNAVDYSGYPDCRPEFLEAFVKMAQVGMRSGVEGRGIQIHAPLLHLSKKEIIQKGAALGVDYSLTSSCYQPSPEGRPCQKCDSCFYGHAVLSKRGSAIRLLPNCS